MFLFSRYRIQNAKLNSLISAFSVYPNPTAGVVYFNSVIDVRVYTINGSLLQEKTGDSVDLSDYPQDTYLLQEMSR
ncbi:MAG: T9SS type A sorting domain-containing protein [Prevotellaceae bacterium]|nr:T9SS type A sorting domain-containing protein [Prevotellaceae bacterium]